MLVVGPAGAVGVPDRAGDEVRDEDVGEVVWVLLFGDPVAGQGKDARGSAAAAVVVPEAGAGSLGQAGVGARVPATVGKGGPDGVGRDAPQQPEDLGVASRAMAPAVADGLDDIGAVLRRGPSTLSVSFPPVKPRRRALPVLGRIWTCPST